MNSVLSETNKDLSKLVACMRASFKNLVKSKTPPERTGVINEMLKQANKLDSLGKKSGHREICIVTRPLVSLLAELQQKPHGLKASVLRALAGTLDYYWDVVMNGGFEEDFGKKKAARVLVVDDEPLSLRATVFALENGQFQVTGIESPEEALSIIDSETWGLFLLDINMPDISGYDLCRSIRTSSRSSQVPVIFVTGDQTSEVQNACTECGGNDIVSKPFSFPELNLKCWTWNFWSLRRQSSGLPIPQGFHQDQT